MATRKKQAKAKLVYPQVYVATGSGPQLAHVAWKGERFAVTQNTFPGELLGNGGPQDGEWVITHLMTGMAMGGRKFTLSAAKKHAKAIDSVAEFSTTSFNDLIQNRRKLDDLLRKAIREAGLMDGVR